MRADETTNFAIYLYLFIFGIHVYAATIHNTTEETSREEYVSTIEHERIMNESHSFACIWNYFYSKLIHYQINLSHAKSLDTCMILFITSAKKI